jgi:hypothetical protein
MKRSGVPRDCSRTPPDTDCPALLPAWSKRGVVVEHSRGGGRCPAQRPVGYAVAPVEFPALSRVRGESVRSSSSIHSGVLAGAPPEVSGWGRKTTFLCQLIPQARHGNDCGFRLPQ